MIQNKLLENTVDSITECISSVKFIKTDESTYSENVTNNDFKDNTTHTLNYSHEFRTDDINNTKIIQFLDEDGEVLIEELIEPPIDEVTGGLDKLTLSIDLTESNN